MGDHSNNCSSSSSQVDSLLSTLPTGLAVVSLWMLYSCLSLLSMVVLWKQNTKLSPCVQRPSDQLDAVRGREAVGEATARRPQQCNLGSFDVISIESKDSIKEKTWDVVLFQSHGDRRFEKSWMIMERNRPYRQLIIWERDCVYLLSCRAVQVSYGVIQGARYLGIEMSQEWISCRKYSLVTRLEVA